MTDPKLRPNDGLDSMAGKTLRIFMLYCGFVLAFLVVSKIVIDVVLAFTASGHRFSEHEAEVSVNPNFPAWTGDDRAVEEAVLAAAREWTLRGGADFRFLEGGRTDAARVDAGDGVNAVFYLPQDSGFGALASTFKFIDNSTGEIVGFDVVFWDRDGAEVFDWSAGRTPSRTEFDVQDTATHELGHALGLGHSDVGGATMGPFGSPGSTSARSLHADDQAGVQFLYGAATEGGPVVTAVVPSESELRGGGTVQVTGAGLAGAALEIGDSPAEVLESSDGWIRALVPAGAAVGPATVRVLGAAGAETLLFGAFAYVQNPATLAVEGIPELGETVRFRVSGPSGGALAIVSDRKAGSAEFGGVRTGLALTATSRTVADSLFETVARRPRLSVSGEAVVPLTLPEKPGLAYRTFLFQALTAPAPGAAPGDVGTTAVVGLSILP